MDRFGKTGVVKAIRYFSPDSAVDGVVLDVLLNKAREIHKALGTYVPVPDESESVTEAVLQALFLRRRHTEDEQLQLDLGIAAPRVAELHRRWDRDVERERVSRSLFAQASLRPAEVRTELEATDAVLGDLAAVQNFVLEAAQRLNLAVRRGPRENVWSLPFDAQTIAGLPEAVRFALPPAKNGKWMISFISPTPEGAECVGRNHPFVTTIGRYLMEDALTRSGAARATRCGVMRTRAVQRLSAILLLRIRYLLQQPDRAPLLSEEVVVKALTPEKAGGYSWLADTEALRLLGEVRPEANIPMAEKRELIAGVLERWLTIETALRDPIAERASSLQASHRRVRRAVHLGVRALTVTPQLPADLLGLLVLQPFV